MRSTSTFRLRDGTVFAGASTWRVRCLDARLIAGSQWFEVALAGDPNYTVVLKVSAGAGDEDARRALEWWLRAPGRENGDVIEVML